MHEEFGRLFFIMSHGISGGPIKHGWQNLGRDPASDRFRLDKWRTLHSPLQKLKICREEGKSVPGSRMTSALYTDCPFTSQQGNRSELPPTVFLYSLPWAL